MDLDLKILKEIANGACRIEENNGYIFHRFTEEQLKVYEGHDEFYKKALSTPCIALKFETDSRFFEIEGELFYGTSRTFYAFDLFVNGEFKEYAGNIDNPNDFPWGKNELGRFCHKFDLGEGVKSVSLVLPFSVSSVFKRIAVDEGAFVKAIKPRKRMIFFGDSITHGYDALHPSNLYSYKIAEFLEAEGFNKAIGGEVFQPELARFPDDFLPDYIAVAYGTNDWNVLSEEDFKNNCVKFFANLRSLYKTAKIFAITPIWRKDYTEKRAMEFHDLREFIARTAEESGAIPIDGFNFVPHDELYFSDKYLHPNDKGLECYYSNLRKYIKKEDF